MLWALSIFTPITDGTKILNTKVVDNFMKNISL